MRSRSWRVVAGIRDVKSFLGSRRCRLHIDVDAVSLQVRSRTMDEVLQSYELSIDDLMLS